PSRAGEIRAITNLYLRLKYAPHSAPHKSDVRKQKAARIQPQPSKSGDTLGRLEQELAQRVRSFKPI
ncbi:MAG TPA: hypothetical protein VM553_12950, partial [Dongiaceae bacterium]|nr:hypothetical protein [Dongiaceae bacterium]